MKKYKLGDKITLNAPELPPTMFGDDARGNVFFGDTYTIKDVTGNDMNGQYRYYCNACPNNPNSCAHILTCTCMYRIMGNQEGVWLPKGLFYYKLGIKRFISNFKP